MRWLAYSRDAHRLPRAPARRRRRPAAGGRRRSPPRTSSATWRRPRRRGSRSSGAPSTSTGSTQALEHLATIRSGSEQARDDLDAYCEFVRTTPLRLGLEVDFVPGAEDRIANLLDAPRLRLRDRLGPLHRRPGRRRRGLGHLGGRRRPGCRLAPLLRDPRRGGAQRPVRHPRPPRPGEGVGARQRRCRNAIRASTTSRRWRRSPRPGSRSRSRPRGCESRCGELYPAPAFAAMCVDAGAAFAPLLGRARARGRGPRVRARGRRDARMGDRARSPSSSGRERRLEPLG